MTDKFAVLKQAIEDCLSNESYLRTVPQIYRERDFEIVNLGSLSECPQAQEMARGDTIVANPVEAFRELPDDQRSALRALYSAKLREAITRFPELGIRILND